MWEIIAQHLLYWFKSTQENIAQHLLYWFKSTQENIAQHLLYWFKPTQTLHSSSDHWFWIIRFHTCVLMKLRMAIIACCDVFVPVAKETRHHIIKWAIHISICVNSKKLNKIQIYHTVITVHSNQGNQCCYTERYDREHSHINITGRTMLLYKTL